MSQVEKPKKQLSELSNQVMTRFESLKSEGIKIPSDYSPQNAMTAAQLHIAELVDRNGKLAVEVCTPESIASALLKMLVQGLSVSKNQCYFIVYGNKLMYQRSYFGGIALAKRVAGVKDVFPVVIYEDDEFEFEIDFETGCKKVTQHKSHLKNINNDKIAGAYAVVHYPDGSKNTEIMTMAEIQDAWNQGQTKGDSPAHKNFRQEMAKKSVVSRAVKIPINSSSDAHYLMDEDYIEDAQYTEVVETKKTIGMMSDPIVIPEPVAKPVAEPAKQTENAQVKEMEFPD